jgi:ATP-dependent helicase/nuclease subunit A
VNLTPAQHQAIYTHDTNLIVVAGAGSGKTRVLVERYLALLDAHPDWPLNALVAITFTRKAAQEMRDRVRQALEDRLHAAITPDDQRVWATHLASMDSARINTIHGLCTDILRANAAAAGLDPDFGVLDEVEASILLDAVIDDELQRLVQEHDPALRLFSEYDRSSIVAVLRHLVSVPLPDLPTDPLAYWQNLWENDVRAALQRLRQDAGFISAAHWQPPDGWPTSADKLLDVWQACSPLLETVLNPAAEPAACLAALRLLGDTIKVNVGSAGNWGGKETLTAAKDALRAIREQAQATIKTAGDPPGPLDAHAARLLPLWQRLIGRVQGAFDSAKQQQSQLDFDDLERRTVDLLVNHPAVRARYQQAEFRHVLVDEFQDTNAAQWAIVQALADPRQPGSLFLVGDQKQSIYAFRGADVSVFGRVRAELRALGGADIPLARSFRTHQPLVSAFNAIFDSLLRPDPASPVRAYETELDTPMDAQRAAPPSDLPPLELLLVDASDSRDSDLKADDRRRWEAYEIGIRLRQMVETQTPVYDRRLDRVRPVQYDDMAILFQSMSQVLLYEEVFKALELPFVTVAGRGYYSRPEVWDLLNLLKALYNPADNLALASVLRSPLFGLSDEALLALRLLKNDQGERLALWEALNQPEQVPPDESALAAFARDCLYGLAALAGRVTIADLLRAALDQTGFLATLTGLPDGARRRGNVEKLLRKAESSGKVTLGAFEQYLSDLSAREVREGEAPLDAGGALTLMTVHASKGLEFPVVALADTSWKRGNRGDDTLTFDPDCGLACKVYDAADGKLQATFAFRRAYQLSTLRDEAERRRLLYVAATRAQDYLIIGGQIKWHKTQERWTAEGWLGWLLEALNLSAALDTPGESVIPYDWGALRLWISRQPPEPEHLAPGERRALSAWDQLGPGQPLAAPMQKPPLAAPLPVDRRDFARHLTVTQLAELGASLSDRQAGKRFRRAVLHDAPAQIGPVPYPRSFKRLVGEMVHEALRWWQPGTEPSDALLQSLAWGNNIIAPEDQQQAIGKAKNMLSSYQKSDVYRLLTAAAEIYRELPFIYDTGQRIIHGVIDVLLRLPDDTWAVIDYKTSVLPTNPPFDKPTQAEAEAHAQRYHMQVGAYAAAVGAQLKLDAAQVAVYIHYVQHQLTVTVPPAEWQQALSLLEPSIGQLMEI